MPLKLNSLFAWASHTFMTERRHSQHNNSTFSTPHAVGRQRRAAVALACSRQRSSPDRAEGATTDTPPHIQRHPANKFEQCAAVTRQRGADAAASASASISPRATCLMLPLSVADSGSTAPTRSVERNTCPSHSATSSSASASATGAQRQRSARRIRCADECTTEHFLFAGRAVARATAPFCVWRGRCRSCVPISFVYSVMLVAVCGAVVATACGDAGGRRSCACSHRPCQPSSLCMSARFHRRAAISLTSHVTAWCARVLRWPSCRRDAPA
jgi:hypothetical protein